MSLQFLVGPPGAGKTEHLVSTVGRWLEDGARPDEVGLFSFTNAAVDEARQRTAKGLGLTEKDLPHFRTLHSYAFRALGCRREEIMGRAQWKELSHLLSEDLESAEPDGPPIDPDSATLVSLDQMARATLTPLKEVWSNLGAPVDWWRLERYVTGLRNYKAAHGLMDFTDLLERVVAGEGSLPGLTHAVVDEAQDLTPLQWSVAHLALQDAEAIIAGDDDQAVYQWAGADVSGFRELAQHAFVQQLPKSWRLYHDLAAIARSVTSRLSARVPKIWEAGGTGGTVDWVLRPEDVDLSKGTRLLLARTRYQLKELAEVSRTQGVNYSVKGVPAIDQRTIRAVKGYEALRAGRSIDHGLSKTVCAALKRPALPHQPEPVEPWQLDIGQDGPIWHDALIGIPLDEREFYLTLLRRGERLTEAPRVRIETIHGAKGLQAEHVMLLLDLTARVARGMEVDPDAENRVLYVGLTRASKTLTLVMGRGPYRYEL